MPMDRIRQLWSGGTVLLLDGAMGTVLQQRGLPAGGVPELLNLTRPDLLRSIHQEYLEAGSQVVYTNTFGANRLKLSRTDRSVAEVVSAGVRIAREAVNAYIRDSSIREKAYPLTGTENQRTVEGQKDREGQRDREDRKNGVFTEPWEAYRRQPPAPIPAALVALDIGPLGELLEPMGTLTFERAYELFREIAAAGAEAGADLAVIETMSDLYEAKAALLAVKETTGLPCFVTMSFDETGRTFTGCTVASMARTLEGLGADAVGLNCSLGPDRAEPLLRELRANTRLPVIAKPNAGLPDPVDGHYDMDPASFAAALLPCLDAGITIFGGCCGTSPEYIRVLRRELDRYAASGTAGGTAAFSFTGDSLSTPRKPADGFVCTPSRPLPLDGVRVIGERINPTGKKRFQQALLEKDLDYIVDIAIQQEDAGADILDVNVGFPGVDEVSMLPLVVKALQSAVSLPLQLDSSNPDALEAGLRVYNGKASVNSVNGDHAVLNRILPVVKKYGASVVGLTLDRGGVPKTAEDRFRIAQRIVEAAFHWGIRREDVWIDCLALTVSAQQEQARETLNAIRRVREELGVATVLGVSNISFGLPNRALVTQTFLIQAMEAGLTLPIVNPNQREIMDAVSAFRVLSGEDRECRSYIDRFAGFVPPSRTGTPAAGTSPGESPNSPRPAPRSGAEKEPGGGPASGSLTLDEAIVRGLRTEAGKLAKEALQTTDGMALVEQRLIPALDRVGEGYGKGTVFLPQLLSAAQAAQAVFEVIRSSLAETGGPKIQKGRLLVATVQGDIHDIGKNIVKTVLENYGYEVLDLGRDVPPETIVETVRETGIRLVGLSALMTTTLPAMEETVRQLQALPDPPKVFVGGAVVTAEYAKRIGAYAYTKDAKASVAVAREVLG